jgi:hypothetical protein
MKQHTLFAAREPAQPRSSFLPASVDTLSLNFSRIHTTVNKVGDRDTSDYEDNISLPYAGEKIGGSDVGHKVKLGGTEYIIKTGISLSLLAQALQKSADTSLTEEDRLKKERKYLNFIVDNFTRISSLDPKNHPEEYRTQLFDKHAIPITEKNFSKILTDEMLEALNDFKKTEKGQLLLEKIQRDSLNSRDVYEIYRFIVNKGKLLKDVLGLAAFSDIVNGAYGQFFNNTFQAQVLPKDMLDDHRLVIEIDKDHKHPAMFMASRFNKQAQSFDTFLLQPFLDQPFLDKKDPDYTLWLALCKENLSSKITQLKGLGSAILIRHLMGERGDLGPDNMLIVNYNDAQHIINIDVTGFRYARRYVYRDNKNNKSLGWEDTLSTYDNNELTEALFHPTVFSNRFLKDKFPEELKFKVMNTIVEVLKSKVQVDNEVQDVREWLQSQNAKWAVDSLHIAIDEAYRAFDNSLKPQDFYINKLKEYNSCFIEDAINVAHELKISEEAQQTNARSSING